MKTLKKQIKSIVLLIVLIFSINMSAQNELKNKVYFRVYNLDGMKINKGHIVFLSDSIINLQSNNKNYEINVRDIGFIKTKRSAGNNVLIGSASGAVLGAVLGASSADPNDWILPYTSGEGAVIFGVLGGLGGGAIGGITTLFKNSKTYIINGDPLKWKGFSEMMSK
ncbi:hypothetical protein [Yeosuana sp.]|uniref:hypothetical protein n=1 Tax=Yeosuana sp. TaxID=2529388 RepID=UPI004054A28C|tara:strand:- start:123 stop:623 length:501 start_codon:yes stop_codon:yes gene_type:complete